MSTPQDPYAARLPAPPLEGPPAGSVGGYQPATVSRPGAVVAAVVFWTLSGLTLTGYGAALLSTVGDPATRDALLDVLADSQVQVSAEVLERVLVVLGTLTLVLGLLTVIFGLLLPRRANWARVLATVVGVLGMPLFLPVLPLVVLAIVLQFLPSSNAWFRSGPATGQ